MKESTLVRAIEKAVKARCRQPVIVRKLADRYTRGLPDLQIIAVSFTGLLAVLEVECKVGAGKLTALQALEMEKTNELGAHCARGLCQRIEARSVADVLGLLESWGCLQ